MGEKFISRLNIQLPLSEPDCYIANFKNKLEAHFPEQNFVISRTRKGEVLSRYGDDIWDLSPYTEHARANRVIYFKRNMKETPETKTIINEYKWIMFMLIFISDHGRAGFLSVSTICRYAQYTSYIAKYCILKKLTFSDLLEHESEIRKFFNDPTTAKRSKDILTIINALSSIDRRISGLNILDNIAKTFGRGIKRSQTRQTIIIPSRIFSEIISSSNDYLNDFISIQENFCKLVKKAHKNKAFARSKSRQRSNVPELKSLIEDFPSACRDLNLSSYMAKKDIHDLHDVSKHIRKVQYACKLLIHIYTGMRDNEVSSLKYDCLHQEVSDEGRVFLIVGETTKLIGVKKVERWITSQDAIPAINTLKIISKTIAECTQINIENHILFLPVSNLSFSSGSKKARKVSQPGFSDLKDSMCSIIINECDIKELKKIAPNADWLSETRFQVGSIWPISSHQFRRTLAVYAAQSGLVTLPSLKRQLKHISREMTLYYSSGSSICNTLFGENKEHIRHDYNDSKSYGEGLGYIYNLLISEQTLHGSYGNWLEKHKRNQDDPMIIEEREKIIMRFKRGELAYSQTPLGACLNTEPCDKKAMRAVSACISCEKAVIIESKLKNVINQQQNLLQTINSELMEYRMELEQLKDLKRLQKQIKR